MCKTLANWTFALYRGAVFVHQPGRSPLNDSSQLRTPGSGSVSGVPQTATEYYLLEGLSHLYGSGVAADLAAALLRIAETSGAAKRASVTPLSAADVMLITYADSLVDEPGSAARKPLAVLKAFADTHLVPHFSAIHVLPFFPSSSDDGFAVVDYGIVREDLGDWADVDALGEHFELMFDLVINHCSREHVWFAEFISGQTPGVDFFIEHPPETDVADVVRPRSSPLLSRIETHNGPRHVWTTFSDDQIDLNFRNPVVLLKLTEILFDYVARGASYLRLDAIAFLWKRLGTSCMSLPQTHMVVKLFRLLLEHVGMPARLLTETNVPHEENVSYFGQQDEAHMVYQFSLAPLLVYSYLFNDGRYLQAWARALDAPPAGCTYLNFIASHDGIGLRPLEGLVPDAEIEALIGVVHERGGFVSLRTGPDGAEVAYEMNVSLFAAFGGKAESVPAYLAAHQLLLAFQGVPAFYLRALTGSANDMQAVERTGRTRSINRGQLDVRALTAALGDDETVQSRVFDGLMHSVAVRRTQPAFSPDAAQVVLSGTPELFVMRREAPEQTILVFASFLPEPRTVMLASLLDGTALPETMTDLLTGVVHGKDKALTLAPHQVLWLELERA